MWRFFRWWCLARLTLGIPLVGAEGGDIAQVVRPCWLCGAPSADLAHVLTVCPFTRVAREGMPVPEGAHGLRLVLAGHPNIRSLYACVRVLGVSVSLFSAARPRAAPR